MKLKKLFLITSVIFTLCIAIGTTANAETEGIYTYSVSNGVATITDCDTSASGAIVIPSTLDSYPVTSISDYAFNSCDSLTSINLPNGVTNIGSNAFSYCDNLTSINIPDGVTSIGMSAFSGCSKLASINIPNSITSIGNGTFLYCNALKKIYIDDLESWCKIDFQKSRYSNPLCNGGILYINGNIAKDLVIPNNITRIGNFAFAGCITLESIQIPNSVTSIGSDTFFDCKVLSRINLPYGITSIEDYTFHNCDALSNIHIPDSVTNIGSNAFSYCNNLTSINIPDSVTGIGNAAFSGCSKLTSINIPKGITEIYNDTFNGCGRLTDINIPNSVEMIFDNAFLNCLNLKNIYYYGKTDDWNNITILSGNECLTSTKITYLDHIINISATPTSLENKYSFDIAIDSTKKFEGILIIGIYDISNCLIGVSSSYADLSTYYFNTTKEVEYSKTPHRYKIFFWNSLSTLTPMCESIGSEI